MEGAKSLFMSKTFWGAAVSVLGSLAGLFGYAFGPDEQEVLVQIGSTLVGSLGAVYAMYGRVKATKAIG